MYKIILAGFAACLMSVTANAAPGFAPALKTVTQPAAGNTAILQKVAYKKRRRKARNALQNQQASLGWNPWAGQTFKTYKKKKAQPLANKSKKGAAVLAGGPKPHISPIKPSTVAFNNSYGKGSIVIDTAGRKLYYVLSSNHAYRYPIAVGRKGYTWTGTQNISRIKNWPEWRPPAEMRKRKPSLPKLMKGGLYNPLGAKALYLGKSLYRIHGTNNVKSIGTASSSGCIRMQNGHVAHLSKLVRIGTKVRVLRKLPKRVLASTTGKKKQG